MKIEYGLRMEILTKCREYLGDLEWMLIADGDIESDKDNIARCIGVLIDVIDDKIIDEKERSQKYE